jgi:hypothetical protein
MHPVAHLLTIAFTAPLLANAQCVLPANFKPPADVSVADALHKDLSYTVQRTIRVPVNEFQARVNSVALDSLLRGTKDIPPRGRHSGV